MKKLTFLLLTLICLSLFSQEKQILESPKVDERVELLSIVFRLAAVDEYSSQAFKLYTDKIENYFGAYKNHELIEFVRKIHAENGIGYDAVMSMAIYLGKAPQFKPLVEFSDTIPEKRWGKENALKFIALLQKFYNDTNCKKFFEENGVLYKNASAKFIPVYNHLDLKWYQNFYGKNPSEKFVIVNGLGNGPGNYGPSIVLHDGKKEVYAIMGAWSVDSTGMVKFNINGYFPTLLHEFNHSFVNYLTVQNSKNLEESGKKIYAVVAENMRSQAYGNWKTMINESIVRAGVIKYMRDHNYDKKQIEIEMSEQLTRGFLWINELCDELDKYDQQRDQYPTLESYMPTLIKAFSNYAENIKAYESRFDERRPNVLSISEFKNNDQNVNSEIKAITINFDKPLSGRGFSIRYGSSGKTTFPKIGELKYSEDKKTVFVHVELEKDKEFQFVLFGKYFRTADGIPMKEYEINFKTK